MIRHYVLTLDGNAQRLSSVLTGGADGPNDRPLRSISLQPAGANANPIFLGHAGVSSTDFGVRLEPGATNVPPAPFVFGELDRGAMKLSEFYVIGTSTQKLHILVHEDL